MNKLLKSAVVLMGLFGISARLAAECNLALPVDVPSSRFITVEQQFVVDTASGLMWHRCALGQVWQNGACEAASVQAMNWGQALNLANDAVIQTYSDWRLPNRKELESIVERRCFDPAINTELFPSLTPGLYWTSTPNSGRADASWVVDFSLGQHRNLIKTEPGRALMVREYQTSPAE